MVGEEWAVACRIAFQRVGGVITALLVVPMLNAQESKPWNVDRVCGRVEYVKRIPDKKRPSKYSEKGKNLRNVQLELYESGENPSCCMLKSSGWTITGRDGEFEFKGVKAGDYLLMANWNGKKYQVSLSFKPKEKSTTVCSEQGIRLEDDGTADWFVTVTVD